jgi:uncharacterized protein
MSSAATLAEPPARAKAGVVDCDIHPSAKPGGLKPFLARKWQEHVESYGATGHGPHVDAPAFPLYAPEVSRRDAWPPDGGLPGSDLDFMRRQHLDPNGIAYGILMPMFGGLFSRNLELGAALAAAVNDWQVATLTGPEPRLKASIQIPYEDAAASVAEIERRAGDPAFVQIQLASSSSEPLGRRRYWPIFEAAQRTGLPLGMHIAGSNLHARSGGGWPSFYMEAHYDLTHGMQAQLTSMILEGVFEQFPDIRIVLVEGGFAWVPSLGWRLDRLWTRMRDEVPHAKHPPSHYLRRNVFFTTQPMEEPDDPAEILLTLEQIGWDHVLFSTDYPHWDFDDPRYAFKVALPEARKRAILHDNAAKLYRLT